jgi:hypothetical protein
MDAQLFGGGDDTRPRSACRLRTGPGRFPGGRANPCWRTRWTGLVALLRAVGYVLKDIDAKQDDYLKKASDDAWYKLKSSKPDPLIFHEFIDLERYNVVHLYRIGARLNTEIVPGSGRLSFSGESQQGHRFDHL